MLQKLCLKVNFGSNDSVTVHFYQINPHRTGYVYTRDSVKKYKAVFSKGAALDDYSIIPWGHKRHSSSKKKKTLDKAKKEREKKMCEKVNHPRNEHTNAKEEGDSCFGKLQTLLINIFFLPLLFPFIHGKLRPLEPDPLYEAWQDFAELQKLQSFEINRDFPVDDRLYASLRKCGHFNVLGEKMTENIQPSDIEIYAEIGHLTTFCRGDMAFSDKNITMLNMNDAIDMFKKSCLESMQIKSKNPTIPKILGVIGANLRVIESNVQHKNLAAWTKSVIHLIEKVENYHMKWKMILIAPGLFDAEVGSHTHHMAHRVLQSIQLLNHRLPYNTLIIVIRNSKQTFWKQLADHYTFCQKIHLMWQTHEGKNEDVWNVLEQRIKKNFQSENFYTHILPIIEETRPIKEGKTYDISSISPDCVHFSSRGLSLLHISIWNWLVQPARQVEFTPLVRPLYCPRPSCPFFVTKTNTYFCPQTKQRDPQEKSADDYTDVLILGMLLLTITLYTLLLIYMSCY